MTHDHVVRDLKDPIGRDCHLLAKGTCWHKSVGPCHGTGASDGKQGSYSPSVGAGQGCTVASAWIFHRAFT